jgi:hypothetical protein
LIVRLEKSMMSARTTSNVLIAAACGVVAFVAMYICVCFRIYLGGDDFVVDRMTMILRFILGAGSVVFLASVIVFARGHQRRDCLVMCLVGAALLLGLLAWFCVYSMPMRFKVSP